MVRRLLLPVMLLSAPVVWAQVVGGTISGTITDTSGAVIPNAVVEVRNQDTGTQRTLTTNAAGTYAAPSIPVGEYRVSVKAPGFAAFTREHIGLAVGQSLVFPVTLVAGDASTIDVSDKVLGGVNLSTEQTSGLVSERQVKELPLNGRSYDQLITLNPGTVNYTAQRAGRCGHVELFGGQHVCGVGPAAAGQSLPAEWRGVHGRFADQRDAGRDERAVAGRGCGARVQRGVAIRYSAAYGKRDGAQISIVTASGTNTLHGVGV